MVFGLREKKELYLAIQLLFSMLIIGYSYSLHYLILTGRPFPECLKESKKLFSGKKIKNAVSLILWTLFILLATAVITFAVSFLIIMFIKGVSSPHKALVSSLKVLRYEGEIFSAISAFFSTPAVMC